MTVAPASRRLGVAAAVVDDRLVPGDVTVADGRIAAVGVLPAGRDGIAAPGLVDLQVNGYAGADFVAADPDAVADARRALAADGVTAFLPTLITGPADEVTAAAARLTAAPEDEPGAARLLGLHLEGPWISPERLGTHPGEHRRDPAPEDLDRLLTGHRVTAVTLAPELPGADAAIRRLVDAGVVVFAGHSDADAAQAHAAFAAGATGVTHLFNAMPPVHHRRPGLAAVALSRPGVGLGLIADGHHVDPELIALVFAAAAGRVALVTDATAASGRPDGEYDLGGVRVTKTGGAVRNASGGLAGSAATLLDCVRTAVAAGVAPAVALHAASTVPARLLRRPDLGVLRPGAVADVTVVDDALAVRTVLVGGKEAR